MNIVGSVAALTALLCYKGGILVDTVRFARHKGKEVRMIDPMKL